MKQTEILTHATHVNGWFPSRLHELHESKFSVCFTYRIYTSKLSNFSAHVYGVNEVNDVTKHIKYASGARTTGKEATTALVTASLPRHAKPTSHHVTYDVTRTCITFDSLRHVQQLTSPSAQFSWRYSRENAQEIERSIFNLS